MSEQDADDFSQPIMRPLYLVFGIAALVLANPVAAQNAERDMTCIGPYRGERVGYCHLWDNPQTGEVEQHRTAVGADKIDKACVFYRRCVIRARVIPRGEPVEGMQNFTVLKVYSARRGK